jgi:hypothetical protein
MNIQTKELIVKLRNQAIDNVCNKRKLSDGQIERTWLQDDFDVEFARLIIKECTDEIHAADVGDLFEKGYYLDRVAEHIEKHFGIK